MSPVLQPLFIYGAGGHGKVIAEAARLQGAWKIVAFVDDAPQKIGTTSHGVPIIGAHEIPAGSVVALALGRNDLRQGLAKRIKSKKMTLSTIIHPSAFISRDAVIGEGTFVGPLAVVHSDARVGAGCIINSGAIVEHDNVLEDWVHIASNGTLGGEVSIGEGTLIGMSAAVLPQLRVGKWSVVGAGAVVISTLGDRVKAVGVPARITGSAGTKEA